MASPSGQQNQAQDDQVLQYVTFRLDDETYGINVMQIQEVLRYTEIAPVPGAPDYVLGIINLRGNVVTVIDTRRRFGLADAEVTDATRIVVMESSSQVMGILVDSVAEVVYLKASEIETAPNVGNEESAKFIQGVCNKNGELIILVEFDKMLSDHEWAEIAALWSGATRYRPHDGCLPWQLTGDIRHVCRNSFIPSLGADCCGPVSGFRSGPGSRAPGT